MLFSPVHSIKKTEKSLYYPVNKNFNENIALSKFVMILSDVEFAWPLRSTSHSKVEFDYFNDVKSVRPEANSIL